VTLFVARLEVRERRMKYVNAGHPAPILRRSGADPVFLESTGPLISSALVDLPIRQEAVALNPRDLLLLYTDGLTEARGPEGFFGKERLLTLVTRNGKPGGQLLESILEELTAFAGSRPFQDDVTLVGVRVN
jgi:sigma-B regulation protein RsbU (phosphoserine phosphatase)